MTPLFRTGRFLAASVAAATVAAAVAASAAVSTHPGTRPGAAASTSRPAGERAALLTAMRLSAGTWKRLPAAPVTALPGFTVAVWTGREMILHGSVKGRPVTFAWRPDANRWRRLARGPALLTGLEQIDIAVWTGSRMLVLGLTNGAYNPAANTWRRVSSIGDGPLAGAVVAWTGRQVLAWDGTCCAGVDNTGAAYTPATNTWRPIPAAPLQVRYGAMGAWTGKELVVAGGVGSIFTGKPQKHFRDAAAYNPATRTWRKLAPMPAPRAFGTALWDGHDVLFIGGAARVLAYDPVTNRWRWLAVMPSPRFGFAAVWTGRQVLLWGGLTSTGVARPFGEAFNPAANRWRALPKGPLSGRAEPAAVWAGRQLILWGGYNYLTGKSYTDGAAYTPRRP
jgi:hypothetical protein